MNEYELKLINIDVDAVIKQLQNSDALFCGDYIQQIWTYNVPNIYLRYLDVRWHLKNGNFDEGYHHFMKILPEVKNLLPNDNLTQLETNFLDNIEIKNIILSSEMHQYMKQFEFNPNKWIRLRRDNNITTLTVKHVLYHPGGETVSCVLENEIAVDSFVETNNILENIGCFCKSKQEKRRILYRAEGCEISIDFWPHLNPYIEVEGPNFEIIDKVIEKYQLGNMAYSTQHNTETLYREIGIDINATKVLSFPEDIYTLYPKVE